MTASARYNFRDYLSPRAQLMLAGISLLVVERGMAGFSRGRNLDKIGMHAQDTSELSFADVRVPVANLLGEEVGDPFAQAGFVFDHEDAQASTLCHVRRARV